MNPSIDDRAVGAVRVETSGDLLRVQRAWTASTPRGRQGPDGDRGSAITAPRPAQGVEHLRAL